MSYNTLRIMVDKQGSGTSCVPLSWRQLLIGQAPVIELCHSARQCGLNRQVWKMIYTSILRRLTFINIGCYLKELNEAANYIMITA